jgi:hypothetical protein
LETRARDRLGEPLIHPTIAAALAAIDGAGVRWCLLRGESRLATLEGDVDLLVDGRDVARLEAALGAAGGFVVLPAAGRGSHRFYAAYDAGSDAWLKLDVVTELAFGRFQELPTRAAGAVLGRRRRFGVLVLPDPSDGFWAELLHTLFDRRRIRPEHAREVGAAARGAWGRSSPLSALVDTACPEGWSAARVLEAAAGGRWDELEEVGREIRARWPGAGPIHQRARVDANRGLRRLGTVPAGARTRGPGLVLVGADEALRQELADAIVASWPSRARVLRAEPEGARRRRLGAARRALVWRTARERGELVIADGDDALGAGAPARADVVVSLLPGSGLSMRLEGPDLVELDAGLSVAALRRVVTEVVWSRWAQRSLPAGRYAPAQEPR